jgi:hypothetical protein
MRLGSEPLVGKPPRHAVDLIRSIVPADPYDLLTAGLLASLVLIAWLTVGDYAISNDEGLQHRYGELIIEYYRSGFRARDLFAFENLYLYGGLFDVIAVALSHVFPVDPYQLRHVLCATAGIAGIAASAATARMLAGPRAGLIAAVALSVCGAWYGAMFNHTKDIPFAAAMMGATYYLVRLVRLGPSPRWSDILGFGILAGAALGLRSLGLLLFVYLALAILVSLPWRQRGYALSSAARFTMRVLPGAALACAIMMLAWPWSALSPFNAVRGLFAFSEFHYPIHTLLSGQVFDMADVPRFYIPDYILVRIPVIVLAGAAVALASNVRRDRRGDRTHQSMALLSLTVIVPLAAHVALHGPAFTGMRHFLFVLPPIAALAGMGLDLSIRALASRSRQIAITATVLISTSLAWEGVTLARLHPYENLAYNALAGGLPGAFRRYDLDYWFNSMPEAVSILEAFVRDNIPIETMRPAKIYSVAVCGERLSFDRLVTLPQLHWDFGSEWDQSDFFLAPTHMNCDRDLDGEIIGTVSRLGVPIAYVKDRRRIAKRLMPSSAPPRLAQETGQHNN